MAITTRLVAIVCSSVHLFWYEFIFYVLPIHMYMQAGHNKRKCKLHQFRKPPNIRPGRPSRKQKIVDAVS